MKDMNPNSWREAFFEIVSGSAESYEAPEVMQRLLGMMADYLQADGVTILAWDAEMGIARVDAVHGDPGDGEIMWPQVDDVYDFYGGYGKVPGWLAVEEPFLLQKTAVTPNSLEERYLQENQGESILFLPLISAQRRVGTCEIWFCRRPLALTPDVEAFCRALIPVLTSGMINLRLRHTAEQRRHEIETLAEVAQLLSGSEDLDIIFRRAIAALRLYITDVKNFSISILEDGEYLRNVYSWKEKAVQTLVPIVPTHERIPVQETFASRFALESGTSFAVSNLQKMPLLDTRTRESIEQGLRSLLYVPMSYKNEIIGLLHLNVWFEPHTFTVEEISLCEGVASQVAIAIASSHYLVEKNRQLRLSETLRKVGGLLTTRLPLQEVYQQIFDLLSEVVSYDTVTLFLLDEESNRFTVGAARGFDDLPLLEKVANSITPLVLEKIDNQKQWRVIEDVAAFPDWKDVPGIENPGSWIGAGLLVKGRMIGELNVDNKRPFAYTEDDGRTVSVFANQAAIAIENARLYDAIYQQASELAVLHQVALTSTAIIDFDDLLSQVTELIVDQLYPEMFGFLLVDQENQIVFPHPSFHGVPEENLSTVLEFANSITGMVAMHKEAILVHDTGQEPHFVPGMADARSEVAVPVVIGEDCVAVINAESRKRNAFSNQDIYFLSTLARNVATAIEKANLYAALMQQADTLAQQVAEQTASLEIERDRMVAILHNVKDGIVLTDPDQSILYVNPAFVTLSGGVADQILGGELRQFAAEGRDLQQLSRMWHALGRGRYWSGELQYQREGGTYDLQINAAPSVDAQGEIHGFVIVHTDISHFKEVERLKSGFISNISHELRTPLTNMHTYLTLVERGSKEKRPGYLRTLQQQTEKLNRLIQDLIDISRLDAQLAPELVGRSNLFELVGKFWQFYEARARQNKIKLAQHFDTDTLVMLPSMRIRNDDFLFILGKVMDNALTFAPEGSMVALSVGEHYIAENTFVWIGVQDHGPGIPPEEIDHIFDRFYRGGYPLAQGIPGTGLGLPLAQELLKRQGGWIEAQSNSGDGAFFQIFLPSEA
jgi:PAS domain S-box-containing protein